MDRRSETSRPQTRAGSPVLQTSSSFFAHFGAGLKDLSPAYFAMVMATGIIAIGSHLLGMRAVAIVLGWLNVVVYIVLWCLTLLRLWRYPRDLVADLTDHLRGPGFFTMVAATCVLGSQCLALWENDQVAQLLWILGVALWVPLTYVIFTSLTIKEKKPSLAEGITGSWLLAVVATQAVAVLTASVAPHIPQPHRLDLNFFALSMWLWGGMMYIWMISLIFYRYTFFPFSPDDLAPPYWINMGAMAISTLGGAVLITNATPSEAPFLQATLPFIKGFTVFYWATGTWWIPILGILGIWRYVYKRRPLTYDPLYWGIVFPQGMYTVSTLKMSEALELEFLWPIPRFFIVVGLILWVLVAAGLARRLFRAVLDAGAEARLKPLAEKP